MKSSMKFDFDKGDFVLDDKGRPVVLEDKEALKMWIIKRLHTMSMGRYKMYQNTDYDGSIDDLVIGKTYGIGFTESELKREITEALESYEDINAVTGFEVDRKHDILSINIHLSTVYGEEDIKYDVG